ncbi:MAG: iron ABC transporter permease [Alphaproteobacteria bacterium]|nr:iron ABC transporter permease [Alphaproteobacteria bacterium]
MTTDAALREPAEALVSLPAAQVRVRQFSPLVLLLILILGILIVPPVIYLLRSSVQETNFDGSFGAFTSRYYRELLSTGRLVPVIATSAAYAGGSALLALLLGGIQAWIVERTNTPLRGLVMIVSIVSLGIPSVLYTISFLLLLGKTGPLNQFLEWATGASGPVFNVYSLGGMIVIQGIEYTPLCFLLLSSVFRSTDASFEEASMMSGAGIGQTFRRITFRLAIPGIAALLILVFIRAFEAFETPALVGLPGRVNVMTNDIYQTMLEIPPNYGEASAFAAIMLVIMAVLLRLYGNFSRHAEKYQTISGKGFRPRVIAIGRWRWLASGVLVALFLALIFFPVAITLWVALVPYYDGINAQALGRFSLANFRTVVFETSFASALVNTFVLGLATASIVAAFTVLSAWLAVRRRPGAWLLDQLASAPLVFPAIVLAVAYLQFVLNVPLALYGTLLSIILASVVQFMPFGMRYSYAGVLQIHRELEEASAVSGAGAATTFLRVVVPLAAPAMVTCWLFVFLMVSKAVSIPLLLAGPNSQVVSVTMFDMWQNGVAPELAALGIIWTAVMTIVSTLFFVLSRRYRLFA